MLTYKILSHFRRYINAGRIVSKDEIVRFCSSVSLNESNQKINLSTLNEPQRRLLKVAIIGVPNVGKSTLINQLVDRRVSSFFFVLYGLFSNSVICCSHIQWSMVNFRSNIFFCSVNVFANVEFSLECWNAGFILILAYHK